MAIHSYCERTDESPRAFWALPQSRSRMRLAGLPPAHMHPQAHIRVLVTLFLACSAVCLAAQPVILRIEPRVGSPLGGTLLTVHGADLPSPTAPTFLGVFIDGQPCDVDILASTPWQLVCETAPHVSSSPLNVSVVSTDGSAACLGDCAFAYSDSTLIHLVFWFDQAAVVMFACGTRCIAGAVSTLDVVSPQQGHSGDLLTITGTISALMDNEIEVSIAGAACALTDSAGNLLSSVNAPYLPFTAASPLSCTVPPIAAGQYNVTLNVRSQGIAAATETALRSDGGRSLFSYEHLARIDTISPASLSIAGGATVTITGTGFSLNAGDNVVTFGGVPARVAYSTNSQLVLTAPDLRTGGLDILCAVVATATNVTQLTGPAAGVGSVTGGSRGALLQIWYGNTSDPALNVTAMAGFVN